MLKQVVAEMKCYERKVANLDEAIATEDTEQIAIEMANVKNELEAFKDAIYAAVEDLSHTESTLFNVERLAPLVIVME